MQCLRIALKTRNWKNVSLWKVLEESREKENTYMPCKRYILEIRENDSKCCDSRVSTWSSEGGSNEIAHIHTRCAETEDKSCGESYRFHGKTSSRRHIARNDQRKK